MGADANPLFQMRNRFGRQRLFRRHLQFIILPSHGLDQSTRIRVARADHSSVVSTAHGRFAVVQSQAVLLQFLAVTFCAVLHQNRADVRFEIVDLFSRNFRLRQNRP